MKKPFRRIAIITLQIIFAICVFTLAACSGSCSSCNKTIDPEMPDNVTTTRKDVPTDGSKPTAHSPADNIAYLAYVLDNQPFYHAYAHNSTKAAMGYEQITQTWKDYKNAELSGKKAGIMICSDVSYSTFVKSATQSCFVNSSDGKSDAVYMRGGSKPSNTSTATSTEWSSDKPSYYSRESYLTTYGEFSTELTVYAINTDTIESIGAVVDNGDGTYSVNAKLRPDAACWYQYGMKTRGGLKDFPKFEKIDITFTFDAEWRILQTYCEEKAEITPSALGGISSDSNSKTTTTFDYSEGGFDTPHYSYFDSYFDKYVGEIIVNEPEQNDPDLMGVLAGAFSKALTKEGQQFGLSLTIGETEYDGNIYLKVEDMEISNLEVRLALGKKDSGNQDLYVEYKGGAVNAYYSDGFAATADIKKVSGSVSRLTEWIKSTFGAKEEGELAVQAEEDSSGLDLGSLLTLVNDGFGFSDTAAWIEIKSDDLLGLGIGIDARLDCLREITEEGENKYDFVKLQLSAIAYSGDKIKVSGQITPDEGGEIITRDPKQTPADIADYIDGVTNLIKGGKYSVTVNFDGTATDINYIKDAKLNATALLNLSEDFKTLSVKVPLTASYSGLTVKLTAYYTIGFENGNYGTVYLNLTEIGGKAVDVKVYSDIKEVKTAVVQLINYFKGSGVQALSEEEDNNSPANTIATIINKVLSLDFGAVITEIKGNSEKLELGIGVDEILNALEVDLGKLISEKIGIALEVEVGTVNLSLALSEGVVSLEGKLPSLGLTLGIAASEGEAKMPSADTYLNVTQYVDGVYNLLTGASYEVYLALVNTDLMLDVQTTAILKLEEGFKKITVSAPVEVGLGNNAISLSVYYTINLSDKSYGTVYLSVESINGKPADVKVYCDIKNVVNTVNEIIALFDDKNDGIEAQSEENGGIADIISKIISIDYATLIEELKADNNGINVEINADYLLGEISKSLGDKLTLGTLALNLTLDENNTLSLEGQLPEMGAELSIKASDCDVTAPDTKDYADAEQYLKGAYKLINGRSYGVKLDFNGKAIDNEYIKNAKLNATALLNLSEDYKTLFVQLPLTVSYSGLTVKLTAYYTIGFENGNYGTVYLHLTEIGGKAVDAKVYSDIAETKTAVEQLIAYFGGSSAETQSVKAKSGTITNIIDKVLALDFGAIIKEIKANPEKIELGIGVDEALGVLNVDLGLEIGTVTLDLALTDGGLALKGSVPSLGLELGVTGSDGEVVMPDAKTYVNATQYVNGLYSLITSPAYEIGLKFVNTDLKLDLQTKAIVVQENTFNKITVSAPVNVTLNGYSLKLTAYYTLDLSTKDYGNVYLYIQSVNDKTVDAKVYCNIKNTADTVSEIISVFDTDGNKKDESTANNSSTKLNIADVISKVVAIEYTTLIGEIKADNTGLKVKVNADYLLGQITTALDNVLSLGMLSLDLTLDENDVASLTGSLPYFGVELTVNASKASVTAPGTADYANIDEYLSGVNKLLGSAVYEVGLELEESALGLSVSTTAFVKPENNFNNITVKAPVSVTYGDYTVALTAFYTINLANKDYGTVFLSIDSINQTPVGAKAYCDIKETADAVSGFIKLFTKQSGDNGGTPSAQAEEESNKIAAIISKVISIDFASILKQLKANNAGIEVKIDADKLLGAIGMTLGQDITFGNVSLNLTLDGTKTAVLSAVLGGLSAGIPGTEVHLAVSGSLCVKASDATLDTPKENEYFNLNELVDVINGAKDQAQAIIDDKDIVFSLDTVLTVDGVKMEIANGYGEVDWNNDKIRVAVSADLIITEGENSQKLELSLVYDEENKDSETAPLVTFAVNDYGMKIYSRDLTDTKNGVTEIVNKIKDIIGKFKKTEETPKTTETTETAENQPAMQSEEGGQSGEQTGFEKVLDIVFNQISNFTVKLVKAEEEDKVAELVISYLNNAKVTLGADGGLSLGIVVRNDNKTEILSLNASVHAKKENENKFDDVNAEFADVTFYTASEEKSFIGAVYEYVRDVFESLTVENLLGADTYEVNLVLNGANSGIKELENIYVCATVRYTDSVNGHKLVEIDAELNISGTAVSLNAVYFDKNIYVSVNRIGDTTLYTDNGTEGIKITASEADIYKAVEAVISIIKNENLTAIIDMFAPEQSGTPSAQAEEDNGVIPDKKTEYALTDILNALFTLEIKFEKKDGNNTLTLNIDSALTAFGLGVEIGTVNVSVNPKTHAVEATVTKADGEWITLSAHTVENEATVEFNAAGYINVNFVADLVEDVNKTLDNMTATKEANGKEVTETDLRISFYGEISIAIDLKEAVKILGEIGAIKFEQTTITAGLDENNEFYFTLYGEVQALTGVIKEKRWVSLTYSNGYITLGRDLKTEPIYKVMTLDYLIDNLLVKGDEAPLRWWLGISNSGLIPVWDTIAGNVNVPIQSSLKKIDEYYVFDPDKNKEEEPTEKKFTLSDIINAIVVDGSTVYGDGSNLNSKLNLSNTDKYYGFDVNGEKLLGSTLPTLYAAILHNDTDGISGLRAYASIANILKPLLTFNETTKEHKENYFKTVTAANENIDFNHNLAMGQYVEIFGCYSTEDRTYDYSKKYSDVKLKVLDADGNQVLDEKGKPVEKTLKYGSIVYVVPEIRYNEAVPPTEKYIYVDGNNNDVTAVEFKEKDKDGNETGKIIGYGFYITADTTIRPYTSTPIKVEYYYNGIKCMDDGTMFEGSILAEYTVSDDTKAFAGWYSDSALTAYVTSAQVNPECGYAKVYAKVIDKTVTEENGVTYTFTRDITQPSGGYYTVTAFNNTSYTDNDSVLVLANEIGGYPVTKIGANVFENKSLKNIVVPENITEVGAAAFKDNKSIQSVVFLSNTVHLSGTEKNVPFYGCSTVNSETETYLHVYYNSVTADTEDWSLYRITGSLSKTYYYLKNVNRLHDYGTWSYVQFVSDNCSYSLAQLGINNFVCTTETYDFSQLEKTAEHNLNELLKADGAAALYAYNIAISGNYELGSIVTMHVSYENVSDENEIWYRLTVISKDQNCSVTPQAVNMIETDLEGVFYVKTGETVAFNLRPYNNYRLKEYVTDVADLAVENNAITMPGSAVLVDVYWEFNVAEKTFVYSEVDFEYSNKNYSAGDKVQLTNAALGAPLNSVTAIDNPATTEVDESTLYTFVGWGVKTTGNDLQFTSATIPEIESADVTYYAIWVENRTDGVTFVQSTTSSLNGIVVEGGTVNSWYDATEEGFTTPVTTLTTATTRLRARMQYTLTVNLSAENTTWGYSTKETDTAVQNVDKTYNLGAVSDLSKSGTAGISGAIETVKTNKNDDKSFAFGSILEGYTVKVYKIWTNAIVVSVLDGSNTKVNYLIKGRKNNGYNSGSNDWRNLCFSGEKSVQFIGNWTINPDELTTVTKEDNKCYANVGEKTSGEFYIANITNIKSDVSFKVVG